MYNRRYDKWLTNEKLELLKGWARNGLTDEQIAKNMDIGLTTLYLWKREYKPIAEALATGKDEADIIVENTMYKAILGYEYEETVTTEGQTKIIKKYMPPNPTLIIFWLKNRKPETWREKKDIELSGEVKSIFEELAKE